MARVHPYQSNFTAGEISPKLIGQVDFAKYPNAVETLENMTVFPQGGATRRYGTRHVTEVKNSSHTTRLIPFEFNVEQAYVLEFGDQYIRFYKDDGQIVEADKTITAITKANPAVVTASSHGYVNGDHVWINNVVGMTEVNGRRYTVANKTTNTFELSGVDSSNYTTYSSNGDAQKVFEIATPYLHTQVNDLKFTQSADTMFIVHPLHEPEKLTRGTSHILWTLTDCDFGVTGPYLTVNDPFDSDSGTTTMTPQQAGTGTGKTITLNQTNGINGGQGWLSSDIGRIVKFNTAGAAKITSINSTTQAVATIVTAFPNADARTDWQLGYWSDTTGFPETVSFFEERLVFGGSTSYPQTVWASEAGNYEGFDIGDSSASNAFIYTIAGNRVNKIRFLTPGGRDLIVGTAGGEFKIGRPTGEPLKPDNVQVQLQTTFGTHTTQPVQIGNAVLFVQRQQRKVREFAYNFQDDAYIAPDMTLLAEHITEGGIVDVDYAQEPDSVYWAVRTDGTLLGMTYQREQDVIAWHKHIIGGKAANCTITLTDYANIQSGTKLKFTRRDGTEVTFTSTTGTAGTNEFQTASNNNTSATNLKNTINGHADFTATVASNVVTVSETTPESTGFLTVISQDVIRLAKTNESQAKVKSVTTITEATENQVWIIVERLIGGTAVRHVAYLDSTVNTDSTLTGTVTGSSTSVKNLDHLEGETVQILIDDAVYPKQKVTNGAITVSLPSTFASKTIEVGLGFVSTLKTLRIEAGSKAGTAQGRKKRYNEIIVRLLNTVGITINGDQLPFRSSADEMGEPIPAFTGDKKVTNLGWNREGQITIKQTQPLPMTVLAVTGTLVTSD
jgi:hypothetical protein